MRDTAGRWQRGTSGNPGGRRREGADFESAARRILDLAVSDEAREALPAAARALLPAEPTHYDALAAVLVTSSLAGDAGALRELLKRVWPAPKPVEVSTGPETAKTLADLLVAIRHEPNEPAEEASA